MQASPPSGLLLVDDHPILRQGLVTLLACERDFVVCAEADNADAALDAIDSLKPDLAIVDLSLNGRPGLGLVHEIRARHAKLPILVLSMHEESLWAERVLRAGACGYVMKSDDPRVLVQRVRRALRGEMALSDAMAGKLLRQYVAGQSTGAGGESALGDRELQVPQLIGHGHAPRDIAALMNISVKTVDAHREHVKRKLNLASVNELLRYATLRFAN